jgi:hypothetical protein
MDESVAGCATTSLSEPPAFFLLVDASNMLELWSPRVRKFVCDRGLLQYGAPSARAGLGDGDSV